MNQRATFLILGLIVWIIGVVAIHILGPIVFDGGMLHILFWIANFVVGGVSIVLIAKFTGRTKHEMLVPTTLMAMPAMLMDGLSVTLDTMGVTHIYANTPTLAAYSGGLLLFAFWSFFFFALLWHREPA